MSPVLTALLIPFLGTALGKAFAAGAMLYVVEELVPEYSQGNHSNVETIGSLWAKDYFCSLY